MVVALSNTEQRVADALVDIAEHYLASGPVLRNRRAGRRYEVVLTIDRNELAERAAERGARYHVDPEWSDDFSLFFLASSISIRARWPCFSSMCNRFAPFTSVIGLSFANLYASGP